jgi:hypothetical protein
MIIVEMLISLKPSSISVFIFFLCVCVCVCVCACMGVLMHVCLSVVTCITQGPFIGSCEHSNEPLGSIKGVEIHE